MPLKFNCPNSACRARIEVGDSLAGTSMACPSCGKALQVPASHEIRFACTNPKCEQPIVVDVSEAGRVLKCPACKKVLRVPGDPPKAVTPVRAEPGTGGEAKASASGTARSTIRFGRVKRLLLGWGIGAAIVGLLMVAMNLRMRAMLPRHFNDLVEEVYSHGGILDAPTENLFGGSLFYFQQTTESEKNLVRLDRRTLKPAHVLTLDLADRENETRFEWFGFSPQRQSFAYSLRKGAGPLRLLVHDSTTGKIRSTVDVSDCITAEGFWLSPETILVQGRNSLFLLNLKDNPVLGGNGRAGLVKLDVPPDRRPRRWMLADSDHSIAYVRGDSLWTLDARDGREKPLVALPTGEPRDLTFKRQAGKYFLLVQPDKKSDVRIPYLCSANSGWTRMTNDMSSAPVWIQGGDGMVYQSSDTNQTFLAVRPSDPRLSTNLFVNTDVWDFKAGADGRTLFVLAEDARGMRRLWEYDIETMTLRKIIPRGETVFREVAPPVLASTTNEFHEEVEYYYIKPVRMDPGRKYPVVVDQNSANRHDLNAQLLANSGIFYVSPNRLGIDNWRTVPKRENTYAVYRELLKNPNIDPERIYIMGTSISTMDVSLLVEEHPEYWRGAIYISQVHLPAVPRGVSRYPSTFILNGDANKFNEYDFRGLPDKFLAEACASLVNVRVITPHSGHTLNNWQLQQCYKAVVEFILSGE